MKVILDGISLNLSHQISTSPVSFSKFCHLGLWGKSLKKKSKKQKIKKSLQQMIIEIPSEKKMLEPRILKNLGEKLSSVGLLKMKNCILLKSNNKIIWF